LDLHISDCRKLLKEGIIVDHIQQRKAFIEIRTSPGSLRKIPLTSFEKIIDLRLREVFKIIHGKLVTQNILQNLGSGGVITGGGAMLPRSSELFHEAFQFPVRVGQPFAANTSLPGIENPRYANIWGALKFAEEFNKIVNSKQKTTIAEKVLNSADGMASSILRSLSNVYKSLKI